MKIFVVYIPMNVLVPPTVVALSFLCLLLSSVGCLWVAAKTMPLLDNDRLTLGFSCLCSLALTFSNVILVNLVNRVAISPNSKVVIKDNRTVLVDVEPPFWSHEKPTLFATRAMLTSSRPRVDGGSVVFSVPEGEDRTVHHFQGDPLFADPSSVTVMRNGRSTTADRLLPSDEILLGPQFRFRNVVQTRLPIQVRDFDPRAANRYLDVDTTDRHVAVRGSQMTFVNPPAGLNSTVNQLRLDVQKMRDDIPSSSIMTLLRNTTLFARRLNKRLPGMTLPVHQLQRLGDALSKLPQLEHEVGNERL